MKEPAMTAAQPLYSLFVVAGDGVLSLSLFCNIKELPGYYKFGEYLRATWVLHPVCSLSDIARGGRSSRLSRNTAVMATAAERKAAK